MTPVSCQIGPRPALRKVVVSLLAGLLRERRLNSLSVLDVGCGNMEVSHLIMEELVRRMGRALTYELKGWDVSEERVHAARALGRIAEVRDVTTPDAVMQETGHSYDLVLMLEVLEHLQDPDAAILNVRGLLRENGFLVISTPNLAAWYNRLFLLFGRQPHCTEVSTRRCYVGNSILGRLLHAGPEQRPAGHMRLFTYRALREFLTCYGFEILRTQGVSNYTGGLLTTRLAALISRLWVDGAGDVVVVATGNR